MHPNLIHAGNRILQTTHSAIRADNPAAVLLREKRGYAPNAVGLVRRGNYVDADHCAEPNAKSMRNLLLKYIKKIELAQEDMLRLRAKEAEGRKSKDKSGELNLFAPAKSLKELLRQPWFRKLRTRDDYDEGWTDALIGGLMQSEWREAIATEWTVRRKRTTLKCMVVGLLKDEGVLSGSYNTIARQLDFDGEKPATLAKYMCLGKHQPFAAWVAEYVG